MKCLRLSVTIGIGLIVSQSSLPQPPAQKTKAPLKNVSTKEKADAKLEAERIGLGIGDRNRFAFLRA